MAKTRQKNGHSRRRVGMYIRLKPEFIRCIRQSAKRKKMTQADFIQCCVALHGKDARTGLLFKFEENNEFAK